jgi:putative ABC transport system permease protein
MNMWASVRIAFGALWLNPLRSVLTMLGIVIGVGSVITMIAVGSGAQERIAEQIRTLGSNLMMVLSGARTAGGARMGFGSELTLTDDDAAAIEREIPEVITACPAIRGGAQIIHGAANWSTSVLGTTPDYLIAREWELAAGRNFSRADLDAATKVALVGQTVAQNLFGGADPIGQTIRIKRVPFTIVGMLDRKGQSLQGQDQDDIVIIPLTTARKRVLGASEANRRSVGVIVVKMQEGADLSEGQSLIQTLLRQRHRIQADRIDDFYIRNLSEVFAAQEASSRVLTMLLASVASVSLVVGGIGIMNIMLVSVTERTKEIGLRMAIGAKTRDILTQFLIEATTLSLAGGAVGVVCGVLASAVIGSWAGWRTVFEPEALLLSVGFSAAVGIFFGYYPARKASRLLPIEALRYE